MLNHIKGSLDEIEHSVTLVYIPEHEVHPGDVQMLENLSKEAYFVVDWLKTYISEETIPDDQTSRDAIRFMLKVNDERLDEDQAKIVAKYLGIGKAEFAMLKGAWSKYVNVPGYDRLAWTSLYTPYDVRVTGYLRPRFASAFNEHPHARAYAITCAWHGFGIDETLAHVEISETETERLSV